MIERQLERIGHMALAELLKYLDIRLKYKPSAATRARLVEYYWLRNTMAHATGYVGVTGQPSIPAGVRVHGNQVRVGKKYFLQMVAQIRRTVESVERLVEKRFFRATSQ